MKRVNSIYRHPLYQKKYNALQKAEEHRRFCNHTLEHFLDVARLMYIYSMEHELSISKEIIYATALMHDIGRIDQIEKNIPHEKAGAALCDIILPDCGFTKDEIGMIKEFIIHHRTKDTESYQPLYQMLYWADKKSRNCFACAMQAECNWNKEKMNLEIDY
ncbi:MAG: HD domain-containing protein [Lachnospiraceae bacterium]|nr:HD domain-containing protein [Lachnospiraceae bacterium]